MIRRIGIGIVLLVLVSAVSCKMVSQLQETAAVLFRGDIVARVGDHKLYRSQLEAYIPSGIAPEDSALLARQWINAWAEDLLLLDMAEEHLSPEEQDVTEELEAYRRPLLGYRYRQLYIYRRLDTLVTDEELQRYYREHADRFKEEGKAVPLEECSQRVRDLILSERKHQLEMGLDEQLMDDALKSNKFEIY